MQMTQQHRPPPSKRLHASELGCRGYIIDVMLERGYFMKTVSSSSCLIPYITHFTVFYQYGLPAMRMAGISKLPMLYIGRTIPSRLARMSRLISLWRSSQTSMSVTSAFGKFALAVWPGPSRYVLLPVRVLSGLFGLGVLVFSRHVLLPAGFGRLTDGWQYGEANRSHQSGRIPWQRPTR